MAGCGTMLLFGLVGLVVAGPFGLIVGVLVAIGVFVARKG